MSDFGEVAEIERSGSVERTVQPRSKQQVAAKKNFRFPVRRGKRSQSKAEIEANNLLIADFIAKKGITVCPPGYASGAIQSQYDFV